MKVWFMGITVIGMVAGCDQVPPETVKQVTEEVNKVVANDPDAKQLVKDTVDDVVAILKEEEPTHDGVTPLAHFTYFQQHTIIQNFYHRSKCEQWLTASKAERLANFTKSSQEKCEKFFFELNRISNELINMDFTPADWPPQSEVEKMKIAIDKAYNGCVESKGVNGCVKLAKVTKLTEIESPY